MPPSEPLISKGTVEHTSNCEFLLKIYHLPSFWNSLSSTKLTYTPYQIEVSLNADVSVNTLPCVSQSINNFSDYDISTDISQSVDRECPSLFPHVLLVNLDHCYLFHKSRISETGVRCLNSFIKLT